jgi:peroxiredoxin
MLVISVALNVMLALKIRRLNGDQSAAKVERELKVGMTVPAIPANRVDGAKETISYVGTDRPTVLYIFTPECKWCLRNLDNLRTLIDQKGKEYRFIGISLSEEGLEQYLSVHKLALPVYVDVPKETGEVYKMGGTPQTVVVSPQGQVMQNWVGAYVGDQKSQVEKFFKVTLPGISPNS